jgi:hypothetical protein
MIVRTFRIDGNQRYTWIKLRRPSGGERLGSDIADSSTCDLRSTALSTRAAARSGLLVDGDLEQRRRLTREIVPADHAIPPELASPTTSR